MKKQENIGDVCITEQDPKRWSFHYSKGGTFDCEVIQSSDPAWNHFAVITPTSKTEWFETFEAAKNVAVSYVLPV